MIILSDALRVVNVLLYAAIVVGALWVVMTYYQIYVRDRGKWIGLLPKHVYLIGISYIIYATSSIGISFQYFNQAATPFTILNTVGGLLGIKALRVMIQFQSKRMIP